MIRSRIRSHFSAISARSLVLIGLQAAFAPLIAAAQDLSLPGPYPASTRTVTVTRSNATTFSATMYYPGASASASAPFHPACPAAPIITFGHGFFQPVSAYASTLSHLATHGYVVIATTSESGLLPNHSNFAADISQCITFLEQQNALPSSFVFQHIDTQHIGISGHSMGGGASILASASDPRIDCLATMAAADTSPSSVTAAANVNVPMLLISGSSDTIVPPANNQAHYSSARAPKSFPLISGGFHCGFEDSTSFGCDTSATLSRADQLAITRRLITGWMNLYLKADQTRWSEIWGPGRTADARVSWTSDSGVAVTRESSLPIVLTQGTPLQVSMVVRNTSPRTQRIRVFGETSAPGWIFSGQTSLDLASGAASTLPLTVTAPLSGVFQTSNLILSARAEGDGGSRSWLAATATAFCPADFNMDQSTDFFDYLDFVDAFASHLPSSDFNRDWVIDFFDHLDFVDAFSAGC